jgi:prepilin peptidase dependent protein B
MLTRPARRPSSRPQSGFSLIELMIAMVIGLIVAGAAISLAVNIIRSATASTLYARTTQDMRTVMNVMSRELKRAGFNLASLDQIGTGVSSPIYSRVLTNNTPDTASCVMFGYDTLDIGGGTADSTPGVLSDAEAAEWRGFRRQVIGGVGVVQMRLGGAGVGLDCDSGNHVWVNLTNPRTLDVTNLLFDFSNAGEAVAGTVADPANPAASAIALVNVRPVLLTLNARSPADPDNVRELRQWVRIRADAVRLVAAP